MQVGLQNYSKSWKEAKIANPIETNTINSIEPKNSDWVANFSKIWKKDKVMIEEAKVGKLHQRNPDLQFNKFLKINLILHIANPIDFIEPKKVIFSDIKIIQIQNFKIDHL